MIVCVICRCLWAVINTLLLPIIGIIIIGYAWKLKIYNEENHYI